jgi:p-hydroxybenzoate 3-monooxygenase
MRTQVGIVGAGPAGLLLSHLLHEAGIDSVVLENRSRDYVVHRVRAGVLEQNTVELLTEHGLGERLAREGIVHHGIEIRFDGAGHRIPLTDLTGRSIWIYGQQEVVKDLIDARQRAGGTIEWEVADVEVCDVETEAPRLRYRRGEEPVELACDVIAGCDGYHGVCRGAIPSGVLRTYVREFPFAWLGILAEVAPSTEELIYAHHDRGFALHSLRSPELSRLYLQVEPDEDIERWPDDRIWEELRIRLGIDGWSLADGPVVEKGIAGMRSFVVAVIPSRLNPTGQLKSPRLRSITLSLGRWSRTASAMPRCPMRSSIASRITEPIPFKQDSTMRFTAAWSLPMRGEPKRARAVDSMSRSLIGM